MFITLYHNALLFVENNHIPASVAYLCKCSAWILAKEWFNFWATSKPYVLVTRSFIKNKSCTFFSDWNVRYE